MKRIKFLIMTLLVAATIAMSSCGWVSWKIDPPTEPVTVVIDANGVDVSEPNDTGCITIEVIP